MTTPSTPPPPADETREQKQTRLWNAVFLDAQTRGMFMDPEGVLAIVESAERAARAEEWAKTIEECAQRCELPTAPDIEHMWNYWTANVCAERVRDLLRAPRPAPAAEQACGLCVKCGDQLGSGETGFCAQCAPAPELPACEHKWVNASVLEAGPIYCAKCGAYKSDAAPSPAPAQPPAVSEEPESEDDTHAALRLPRDRVEKLERGYTDVREPIAALHAAVFTEGRECSDGAAHEDLKQRIRQLDEWSMVVCKKLDKLEARAQPAAQDEEYVRVPRNVADAWMCAYVEGKRRRVAEENDLAQAFDEAGYRHVSKPTTSPRVGKASPNP